MPRKVQVGIIGLGKFGFFLGKSLVELGHEVIGVDVVEDKVRNAQDILTQVFQADSTDASALEQLRIAELPVVVVSVGHSMEASILISLHLKELGAEEVWVKAISPDHEKVLIKVGVDHVIFPERFAARQLARRLVVPGLVDYLPLGTGVMVREIAVEKWAGKTLRELDLPKKYGVQVVATRRNGEEDFTFVPRADRKLEKGDVLVFLGSEEDLDKLKS